MDSSRSPGSVGRVDCSRVPQQVRYCCLLMEGNEVRLGEWNAAMPAEEAEERDEPPRLRLAFETAACRRRGVEYDIGQEETPWAGMLQRPRAAREAGGMEIGG